MNIIGDFVRLVIAIIAIVLHLSVCRWETLRLENPSGSFFGGAMLSFTYSNMEHAAMWHIQVFGRVFFLMPREGVKQDAALAWGVVAPIGLLMIAPYLGTLGKKKRGAVIRQQVEELKTGDHKSVEHELGQWKNSNPNPIFSPGLPENSTEPTMAKVKGGYSLAPNKQPRWLLKFFSLLLLVIFAAIGVGTIVSILEKKVSNPTNLSRLGAETTSSGNTGPRTPTAQVQTSDQNTAYTEYVVGTGDSLVMIAKNFGTTIQVIETANNLSTAQIKVGQRLIIPAQSTPSMLSKNIETTTPAVTDSLNNGLVAYYPLAGNANDASGNGNNGTVYGAVYETDGRGHTALRFNGTAATYVVIPQSPSLEPQDAITISLWCQGVPGTGQQYGTILRKADNCGAGYYIRTADSSSSGIPETFRLDPLNPCVGGTSSVAAFTTSTGASWQYLVATYSSNDGLRTYVNGVLISQAPPAGQLQHSGDLFIGGATVHGQDGGFNGLINEVRIYNRALSADEIQKLYNSSK